MPGPILPKPLFPAISGTAAFACLALWLAEPPSAAISARFVAAEPSPDTGLGSAPAFEEFVVATNPGGVAHAPTVAVYGDGDVQVVWFAGALEADRSVNLETSRLTGGAWTAPKSILSAITETAERGVFLNTIGNPVLYRHPSGETWLFYVTPKIGGWSTSAVSLRRSTDDGRTWGEPTMLRLSPFFNLSNLVRYQPVKMEGGLVGLPNYLEFVRSYSELAVIDPEGRVVDKRRIGRGIQADLLVDPTRATALIRPVAGMPNKGHMSQSTDGGLTWSEPTPTDWTNPGSPLCAARFEDGREIVAYNDDDTLRSNFAFASRSGGSDEWGRLNFRIESSSGNDWISYCDMDIGTDQTVTMVYSRVADRSIRGVRFNRAWVEAQQAGGAE